MKRRRAEEIGVTFMLQELPETSTTEDVLTAVARAADTTHGVLVQLPLPAHIDTEAVLAAVPDTHDVDAFHLEDDQVLPPVAAAMKEILRHHAVDVAGKRATIVGAGRAGRQTCSAVACCSWSRYFGGRWTGS